LNILLAFNLILRGDASENMLLIYTKIISPRKNTEDVDLQIKMVLLNSFDPRKSV